MTNTYLKGERNAVSIAKKTARRCRAYQKLLKTKKIKYFSSLRELPVIDKYSYINAFPLQERLFENKSLSDYYMICTSTGSTGEPTIWPRDKSFDETLIKPHTDFLDKHFQIRSKKTLIIIFLGLNTSQAGMMHLKASWGASSEGKVTVLSPNGDMEMSLFLVKTLYQEYEQVICLGYPPLISDFLDTATQKHEPIHNWNLKIGTTGESTSLLWRNRVKNIIRGKNSDIISWYGSTETGMIGFETPETNTLLSFCVTNESLMMDLFQTTNLPNLIEVDYLKKFIEIINGEIVITVDQVVPLIRFNLHDKGMFISNSEIKRTLAAHAVDSSFLPDDERIFVAVFGRNTQMIFSIEDIRTALDEAGYLKYFCNEFQFREETINNKINIIITLYKKPRVKNIGKINIHMFKQIRNFLSTLHTKNIIGLKFQINEYNQKIGYKNGKLRYLLNLT